MACFTHKPVRTLIVVMSILVIAGVIIAKIYYRNLNASFDPRTREAQILYSKYNELAKQNDYPSILLLLDSIENIYNDLEHYQTSYEKGVIMNNRAAVFLTFALHTDSLQDSIQYGAYHGLEKDTLLILAELEIEKSIHLYENWLLKFEDSDALQIREMIGGEFLEGMDQYTQKEQKTYLHRRIREIQTAQYETKRRLSVSYTNLGTIFRHQEKYKDAADAYLKALELWDRNLTAENNLNILLNRPLKKRNFFQKLFPPDKKTTRKMLGKDRNS